MTATDYEFQFFLIQFLCNSDLIGLIKKKDIIRELDKKNILYNYDSFEITNRLDDIPYSFIHFKNKIMPPCAKYIITMDNENKTIYTLEVGDNDDYFFCLLNNGKHFVIEHINHIISVEDFTQKIKTFIRNKECNNETHKKCPKAKTLGHNSNINYLTI